MDRSLESGPVVTGPVVNRGRPRNYRAVPTGVRTARYPLPLSFTTVCTTRDYHDGLPYTEHKCIRINGIILGLNCGGFVRHPDLIPSVEVIANLEGSQRKYSRARNRQATCSRCFPPNAGHTTQSGGFWNSSRLIPHADVAGKQMG